LLMSGMPLGNAILLTYLSLALGSFLSAVSTDLMSMRIPNELSFALLGAAAMRWIAEAAGADALAGADQGAWLSLVETLLNADLAGKGAVIPEFPLTFPGSGPASDILCMILVYVPTYLSFRFRLGFGGGDVKLLTAGALYFGWPLGFDFLLVTYAAGGVMACLVLAGRLFALSIPHATAPWIVSLRAVRSFPYAPAIAISAALCVSSRIEGLF
jgi:Flp pilus assembly protein protease CpaA